MPVAWNIPADEWTLIYVPESKSPDLKKKKKGERVITVASFEDSWQFSVPHVPDSHLICQAERRGSQLSHGLAHWEASEVGHQLLFCNPKVRKLLKFQSSYSQRWLSVWFLFTFSTCFLLDWFGVVRRIMGGSLRLLRWVSRILGNNCIYPCVDKKQSMVHDFTCVYEYCQPTIRHSKKITSHQQCDWALRRAPLK